MGPTDTPSSASPLSKLNHQMLHPTSKTLTPIPPTLKPTNTAQDAPTKQRHHSFSSSEEEEPAQQRKNNDWQQIHHIKRKRISSSQRTLQIPQEPIQNRYEMLTDESPTTDHAENTQPPKIHKPPPIFLHGVINYDKINRINEVAETEQFYTKSMANNVIKITCLSPET
jgi:hypothetical protein